VAAPDLLRRATRHSDVGYLVLIVVVFRNADASHTATLNALSLGMVPLPTFTVLQAIWQGPVGSGPPVFSAIYIGPAVLAAGHRRSSGSVCDDDL
jgi:hypothetical protein